jgi:multidrug efflux pump subunit AcrB
MIDEPEKPREIDKLVRTAVILAIAGMLLVLMFLIAGFRAWSVGLGVFLGMPVMLAGVLLYVYAVIRDLRYRNVLGDD